MKQSDRRNTGTPTKRPRSLSVAQARELGLTSDDLRALGRLQELSLRIYRILEGRPRIRALMARGLEAGTISAPGINEILGDFN